MSVFLLFFFLFFFESNLLSAADDIFVEDCYEAFFCAESKKFPHMISEAAWYSHGSAAHLWAVAGVYKRLVKTMGNIFKSLKSGIDQADSDDILDLLMKKLKDIESTTISQKTSFASDQNKVLLVGAIVQLNRLEEPFCKQFRFTRDGLEMHVVLRDACIPHDTSQDDYMYYAFENKQCDIHEWKEAYDIQKIRSLLSEEAWKRAEANQSKNKKEWKDVSVVAGIHSSLQQKKWQDSADAYFEQEHKNNPYGILIINYALWRTYIKRWSKNNMDAMPDLSRIAEEIHRSSFFDEGATLYDLKKQEERQRKQREAIKKIKPQDTPSFSIGSDEFYAQEDTIAAMIKAWLHG